MATWNKGPHMQSILGCDIMSEGTDVPAWCGVLQQPAWSTLIARGLSGSWLPAGQLPHVPTLLPVQSMIRQIPRGLLCILYLSSGGCWKGRQGLLNLSVLLCSCTCPPIEQLFYWISSKLPLAGESLRTYSTKSARLTFRFNTKRVL